MRSCPSCSIWRKVALSGGSTPLFDVCENLLAQGLPCLILLLVHLCLPLSFSRWTHPTRFFPGCISPLQKNDAHPHSYIARQGHMLVLYSVLIKRGGLM